MMTYCDNDNQKEKLVLKRSFSCSAPQFFEINVNTPKIRGNDFHIFHRSITKLLRDHTPGPDHGTNGPSYTPWIVQEYIPPLREYGEVRVIVLQGKPTLTVLTHWDSENPVVTVLDKYFDPFM